MTGTNFDITIIGAGIVGLATAMELVKRRPDLRVVILDKENEVAAHQTGNNSGVIHAGLYYKPGSLKAQMAVDGARLMVEFCQEHDMPHELCGKVVVAVTQEEVPRLEELYRRGTANGVPGLTRISGEQIKEHEPHGIGVDGLWSPNTGIVDYRAVSQKYAEIVEQGGGEVRLGTKVTGIVEGASELVVQTTVNDVHTRALINCARIAERSGRQDDGRYPGAAHRALSRRVLQADPKGAGARAGFDLSCAGPRAFPSWGCTSLRRSTAPWRPAPTRYWPMPARATKRPTLTWAIC